MLGLELRQQVIDEVQLAGVLDLGHHDAVQPVTGTADDGGDVTQAPARGDAVDADDPGLAGVVVGAQRIDHPVTRVDLLQRGHGVLEIEEHLVGRECRSLGEHLV